MTWQELSIEQFSKLKSCLLVDVRSPCEHGAESIPGSHNVPLLSNEERCQVGTVYNQNGDAAARRLALNLIAPKIPQLLDAISALRKHGQTLVIHCWRGGMRSEAVCSVLSMAGICCFRLTGGYKAFRAQVLNDFLTDAYPFVPLVLLGLTGTGKTEILQALQQCGMNTLNLEALANHRGSVFGGIGMGTQPGQKDFDSRLWSALTSNTGKLVFLEGESRKIGRLSLPDCILSRIRRGAHILIEGSLRRRAERIAADYLSTGWTDDKQLAEATRLLEQLKPRLGSKIVEDVKNMLQTENAIEAIEILLIKYYDPLYSKQIRACAPFALEVNSDNLAAAAQADYRLDSIECIQPTGRPLGKRFVLADKQCVQQPQSDQPISLASPDDHLPGFEKTNRYRLISGGLPLAKRIRASQSVDRASDMAWL